MKRFIYPFLLILLPFLSCSDMKKECDLIVMNALVYQVDEDFNRIEAFAVDDGKFVFTGSTDEVMARFNAKNVIDLEGKTVYPGFIDAHCHFYGYGLSLLEYADLTGTGSFDEIIDILKKHNDAYNPEWLLGRGWDQNDWEVKEFPENDILNELFPDKPVLLIRIDGHGAIANAKALEIAGITPSTVITGGEIEVKNGQLTGILLDNAIDFVRVHVPNVSYETKVKSLLAAQKNCFAAGLTTVTDAGLSIETIELIDSLQQSGELKMRVDAWLSPTDTGYLGYMNKGIVKTELLRVGALKLYADGALGSRGACLLEPYSDAPDKFGFLIEDPSYYERLCGEAKDAGYQVNTHAIGDSAVRMVLNTYAKTLKGPSDLRWRIEHSQIVHPDDFDKFGAYSIVPSVQATHATSDMYWADERLGDERLKGGYAYKQLLDQIGWIPNGTDFPVEQIYPLYTFFASAARKDLEGYPEGGFQTENALTREETLRSMTIWAAKASFLEDEIGSIEAGKVADFVVLEKDIMTIPEPEIPTTKVLKTFASGEEIYSNTVEIR